MGQSSLEQATLQYMALSLSGLFDLTHLTHVKKVLESSDSGKLQTRQCTAGVGEEHRGSVSSQEFNSDCSAKAEFGSFVELCFDLSCLLFLVVVCLSLGLTAGWLSVGSTQGASRHVGGLTGGAGVSRGSRGDPKSADVEAD